MFKKLGVKALPTFKVLVDGEVNGSIEGSNEFPKLEPLIHEAMRVAATKSGPTAPKKTTTMPWKKTTTAATATPKKTATAAPKKDKFPVTPFPENNKVTKRWFAKWEL